MPHAESGCLGCRLDKIHSDAPCLSWTKAPTPKLLQLPWQITQVCLLIDVEVSHTAIRCAALLLCVVLLEVPAPVCYMIALW